MLDERITEKTRYYAVIGKSLSHTWSPLIHNSIFSAIGYEGVYMPLVADSEDFPSLVSVLRHTYKGFNVTIPYKQSIIPYLSEIDDTARIMGSVNTVENNDGKLIGHSTDGQGMMRALAEAGMKVEQGMHTIILGAGGAARAAAYALLEKKASITIVARNTEKAEQLCQDFRELGTIRTGQMDICDLLVNCTPVGMYPNSYASPLTESEVAMAGCVFDAVYHPLHTLLLQYAEQQGIPAVPGLGMLFFQAIEAEKYWLKDKMPDETIQRKIYLEMLTKIKNAEKTQR